MLRARPHGAPVSDRVVLDAQRGQWEWALTERADRFGVEPSAPAQEAAALFEREGVRCLLELGGGQGRDSLFFARRGFEVQVLDYSASGVEAIAYKAGEDGLGERVSARQFDVREPRRQLRRLLLAHAVLHGADAGRARLAFGRGQARPAARRAARLHRSHRRRPKALGRLSARRPSE
jgi:hypothetical protein